jgi:hypothetical protein
MPQTPSSFDLLRILLSLNIYCPLSWLAVVSSSPSDRQKELDARQLVCCRVTDWSSHVSRIHWHFGSARYSDVQSLPSQLTMPAAVFSATRKFPEAGDRSAYHPQFVLSSSLGCSLPICMAIKTDNCIFISLNNKIIKLARP